MRARLPLLVLCSLIGLGVAVPAQAASGPLSVSAGGTYRFGKARAVVRGRAWRVSGVVRAGTGQVIVRLYRGKKVVLQRRATPAAGGSFGVTVKVNRPGRTGVEVVRPAAAGGTAPRARLTVFVVDPRSRSGPSMRFLQQRLAAIGYWPGRSGRYDLRTRWAVMAFRKVNRMARNFSLTRGIYVRVARGAGGFVPRYKATGRDRVEARISRQVYVLINAKGRVYRVVPTSTGKPGFRSDIGRFRFYRKSPGTNGLGMVNSVYYNGGEALHGYSSVPPYPASHGCLRTPTTYSRQIMNWVRLGDRIDVYR